jgi:DNA-binding transcriptional MerR regulator
MDKSPDAFRTISEVAEALETPAHVLRFWESRFPQIRPVKRAGGRRYYRPSDVALLTGIKRLLHEEGLTIRGVQKILREQGIRHVADLSDETSPEQTALEEAMVARFDDEPVAAPETAEADSAAALEAALQPSDADGDDADGDAREDWLASLPKALETLSTAPPQPFEDDPADDAVAAEPLLPLEEIAPVTPVITARPVAAVQVISDAGPDDATATIAARLRALPKGNLKPRLDPLMDLSQRIASLRSRMSGQMPPR